jgi:hypothetical protein
VHAAATAVGRADAAGAGGAAAAASEGASASRRCTLLMYFPACECYCCAHSLCAAVNKSLCVAFGAWGRRGRSSPETSMLLILPTVRSPDEFGVLCVQEATCCFLDPTDALEDHLYSEGGFGLSLCCKRQWPLCFPL